MDLYAVREAIAGAVQAGVTSSPPLTCFAFVPSDGPTPFLYVQVEGVAYDQTFGRGVDEITLTLMVMTALADDVSAQQLIDSYLSGSGPASIKEAVDAATAKFGGTAFDGICDDVHVQGTDGPPRWFDWNGEKKYYGAGLKVRVIGRGA